MELIYGPVKSLRYGNTLGVNLLGGSKVCSYNCGYCHLGPTTLTISKIRKGYNFPELEEIKTAFRSYVRQSVPCDAVVISGNGEPTLYPQFEEATQMLVELRNEHLPGVKIIALSSGAHMDSKKVTSGLNMLDERVIKVDAGNDNLLQKVNAPLVRLNMAKFLAGFRNLKDCVVQALFFEGDSGNTSNDAIDEWIEVVGMIKPKHAQLCTITRTPPAGAKLAAVSDDVLYGIAFKLKKRTGLESHVFGTQKT